MARLHRILAELDSQHDLYGRLADQQIDNGAPAHAAVFAHVEGLLAAARHAIRDAVSILDETNS